MIIVSIVLASMAAVSGVGTIGEMIKYCINILKQPNDESFYGDDTE